MLNLLLLLLLCLYNFDLQIKTGRIFKNHQKLLLTEKIVFTFFFITESGMISLVNFTFKLPLLAIIYASYNFI